MHTTVSCSMSVIDPSSAFPHHDLWVPETEVVEILAQEESPRADQPRLGVTMNQPRFSLQKEQLGLLGFEARPGDNNHVMTGTIRCPSCSRLVDVVVHRNGDAVSDKQPAFLMFEPSDHEKTRQVGHLFVGTIRKSPVIYFGEVHHCGDPVRSAVFFNRAFRVSSDAQLVLATRTANRGDPSASDDRF